MSDQIDMTFSVAEDEATERMMGFITELYKDYSPDVVEAAVERGLSEIRDTKARLYASILSQNFKKESSNTSDIEGNA